MKKTGCNKQGLRNMYAEKYDPCCLSVKHISENILLDYEYLLWTSDTQLEVTLRATDTDEEYIDETFTINVNNINEAPSYLSQEN